MQRREFLLGGLIASGMVLAGAARAEPAHWLVGTWIGEVKLTQDKNGTGRRMVVLSVKGSDVALRYGFLATEKPPIVHGTLDGKELRFSGPGVKVGDNPIVLARNGEDELAGTWSSAQTGKSYPISFTRQK